jgi:hypothetical protein
VPWCTHCSRFLSPATVTPAGACPACGRPVDPGAAHATGLAAGVTAGLAAGDGDPAERGDEDLGPLPWHFKLLVAAVAVYLGYRALEGVEWLARQL